MAIVRPNAAIAACLELLASEQCTCETLVARRNNSRILRARCRSGHVAIKECFKATTLTPDPSTAEREFAALTALREKTSATGDQPLAPLPLALCREHAVYAMTWAAGRSVTELVLAPSTSLDRATALGEAAGHWLHRFHALGSLPVRRSDFESKLKFVDAILAAGGDRVPLVRRAAEALVRHATAASALHLPASWVHGDMKSDNLLVDGKRVTGLDMQLIDENTVVYDLAPFLNHLRLLRWSPRGLWQRRKLHWMADAFLRGYSPETEHWRLPICWLRVYLLAQAAAPVRGTRSLRACAARWPVRVELATGIDELQRCP